MAKYTKQVSISGGWVKSAELKNGTRAKIVSETVPTPSSFTDPKTGAIKTQNVAKVRFEGQPEAVNVSLNRATINALVDAFGEDSIKWQGNYLTVETEKVRVAGKAVIALYLIPAGYQKVDDDQGYAQIVRIDEQVSKPGQPQDPEIPIVENETDEYLPF